MSHSKAGFTALILALAIAASVGSGAGAPAGVRDISGRYDGTVMDSVFGRGEIFADLAQYQGAVSGTVIFTFGSPENVTPASFLLNGRALKGSGVFVNTYGHLCPTSTTARYDSSGNLSGSYKVTNGSCSNSSGTFTMKQSCTYGEGPAIDRNASVKRC
jgi:hypothetical protein